MKTCPTCGAQSADTALFCNSCGTSFGGNAANASNSAEPDFMDKTKAVFEELNDTRDNTGYYNTMDIADNKVFAVLAYLDILFLIPLFAAKDSPYARFHTNQGLVLWIATKVYAIALSVVTTLIGWFPIIGWAIVAVLGLASVVFLVLAIIGIVNAVQGKAKELPLIGKITILK